jgi:uncharacterized RDD family membrane protein YckC
MNTRIEAAAAGTGDLNIDSVTGVDVSLPIAGVGGRSFAFIIDWHIRLLFAVAWWAAGTFLVTGGFNLDEGGGASGTLYFWTVMLPAIVVYMLYHPVLEVFMHGRTPGKRMAGVRIVTREGATPGVGAILIRNVFRLIDGLPMMYCLGLAVALLTAQHVRIGDLAAGTMLIYDRGDALPGSVGAFREGGLDPRLTELVEEVLARWKELTPEARLAVGAKVLARVDPAAEPIDDPQELLARLRALLENRAA